MAPQERSSLEKRRTSAWLGSGLALDQSEPKGRERLGSLNTRLKAVKLTDSSQVHLQAVWAVSGHGQVSSCGEAQYSPCSRRPPPPAPPPPHSFFVVKAARGVGGGSGGVKLWKMGPSCCWASRICREGMDSKCLIPLWLQRAPQACLDLPSPKQLGGGGATTEGLTGQEQWRQDSRVLPHGRHMSLTTQSTAPSPWVVGLPPSPRRLPAGPAGEDTNRGRKRGEIQEATFLLLPHPSLPLTLL